ncbi:MAG: extracellular solute-binding protein [Burkholderiales bacterium]|nr:extracellular solute-binding protein [Burkholderiales bacterium]
MNMRRAFLAAAAGLCVASAPAVLAQTKGQPIEIQFWMGLTGLAGELLTKYGEEFNKSQSEYRVVVSFKGQYPEQRAAAIAAYRAGNPPHIMQMFDAGSGDMMSAKGAIVPVSEVFKRAGLQFDPADFIAPARGYYGLPNGELLSMPFNVSTAVLFYNKDAFRRAGLDPEKAPRTWPEVIEAARQIRRTNAAACGFTAHVARLDHARTVQLTPPQPADRHAEQRPRRAFGRARVRHAASAPHGADAGGPAGRQELRLRRPQQRRGGQVHQRRVRDDDAELGRPRRDRARREVRLRRRAAALLAGRRRRAVRDHDRRRVALGVRRAQPHAGRVPRGGSFLNHLRSTPVMVDWAKQTGFLPATNAAFRAMRDEGFFQKNPGRDVPILSLIEGKQGDHTQGYRFGRWTEIRDVYHEEVERALQGRQPVAAAIQNAQRRGNELLRAFERSVN